MDNFLKSVGLAASGAAQAVATGSALAAILGAVYIIDCRITAGSDHDKVNNCYFVGLPIMGIGVAGRSGFKVGYDTLNPALKRPEDEEKEKAPTRTVRTTRTTKPKA